MSDSAAIGLSGDGDGDGDGATPTRRRWRVTAPSGSPAVPHRMPLIHHLHNYLVCFI